MFTRAALVGLLLAGCSDPTPATDGGVAGDAAAVDAAAAIDVGEPDAASLPGHAVLFVGNDDVELDEVSARYGSVVAAHFGAVRTEVVAGAGDTLASHRRDSELDGTPLSAFLRTGAIEENRFDAVVLQEAALVGGYVSYGAWQFDRALSIRAVLALGVLANGGRGARVILYLTWGWEHGDTTSGVPDYGSFEGMADRVDEGYLGVASLLATRTASPGDVRLAPVGGAFRLVFEDVRRTGMDPLAAGSAFDLLYTDGRRASARGQYLAACVLAGTIAEIDVMVLPSDPSLGDAVSSELRSVCQRALVDPRWRIPTLIASDGGFGRGGEGERFGTRVASTADGSRVAIGSSGGAGRLFLAGAVDPGWEGLGGGIPDAVAIDGDGTRLLVRYDAVAESRVYARDGATWSQEGLLPPGPGTSVSEVSYALSEDGARAIVGEVWDAGTGVVAARVFAFDGTAWTQEAALDASLGVPAAVGVAIDRRGERAVVADPTARVFVRAGTTWTVEAMLGVAEGAVALSADGTHAAIANGGDRVTIWSRSGTAWTELAVIRGASDSSFGAAVAVSDDGGVVAVGAPTEGSVVTTFRSGSAALFRRSGARYDRAAIFAQAEGGGADGDLFGTSLSITADGARVVVGAPGTDGLPLLDLGSAWGYPGS